MLQFNLKKPCADCPFRVDCLDGWLGAERAGEIWHAVAHSDSSFTCHKTNEICEETGETVQTDKSEWCYGSLVLLEKEQATYNNVLLRLAAMCERFDKSKLNLDAPVFDSADDFIDHHE